ncbi:efflux transporter [Stereum hirsutum FP-91666 SS1]|uniref:efflux transporter n=1 Tax=Stereum hirsutum (strain FP-91666) TaxID=721885 RepID=UPI000444953D|nr:efflux transporter [Stereum hirsutum FP-91666 SS1]EIM85299.1 efflux transporter [Stereum hirsutum FP-91666 SS1]
MGTAKAVCLIAACTSAMLINTVNNTSVSVALPTIGRELSIAENNLQWLISSYSLSSGCLLIFLGRIADLHGRKTVWLLGFLWMLVFSLGCGFAQDEITVDVLRGLQGIGGAAIVPASLGILAHAFPPSRTRSLAFATFSAGAPVGAAVGMALGGILTQLSKPTWRSTFYLTSGLCLLAMAAGFYSIPPDHVSTEVDKRVDWLGAFLVTAGLVLIVFVLSDGEIAPNQWATSYIITLLVLGVAFMVLFVLWQLYLERVQADPTNPLARAHSKWTPPPLLKMSMWKRANGKFAIMQLIACVNWCSFMSWTFWVQLYYQNYADLSPILTMVRMLPMFITGVVCNGIIALIIGRVDVLYIIVFGTLLTSFSNVFFAMINPDAPYWAFGFPAAILSVFGADFVFAAGSLFIAKVSLPHEQSVAGALFQTMTQLGTALGLAVTTIVYDRVLATQSSLLGVTIDTSGTNAPKPAQLKAYQAAEWTAFGFGILGMVLSLFLRGVGIVGHVPEEDEKMGDEENERHEPLNEKSISQDSADTRS